MIHLGNSSHAASARRALLRAGFGLIAPALWALVTAGACCLSAAPPLPARSLPENLARSARVSASAEFSANYLAKFAVDDRLPAAGGQADMDQAWCMPGSAAEGITAEFTLQWDNPVSVAEVVYYGRTAWFLSECWKDYEVYVDDGQHPVACGRFRMVHGPQRIKLPAAAVHTIRLRFLSSFGGPNPGAWEIQVFGSSPSDRALDRLARNAMAAVTGAVMPWVDQVDCERLRELMGQLMAAHGPGYHQGPAHLQRLDRLQHALQSAMDGDVPPDDPQLARAEEDLAQLQRDVLLHDVDKLVLIKRHEITASHVYTYHYEGFTPGGGLYVAQPHDPESEPVELVASREGQILDCDLSRDGRVILFSWRRRQDEGYHLWTIGVDGSNLTRLTDGRWHDYNACWLPDGDIAFLTTRDAQFAYCWHAPVGVLHRMKPDGSNWVKLSANYLNDFTPQVLDDGRLIYSRWEYVDRPAIPIQSLWTMNPDGTGLSVFYGNRVLSPGTFMEARSIPGTSTIVCTMTGHNGPTRGAIGVIDRAKGVNAQAAITNITPDVPVPPVDQGDGNTGGTKQYSGPYPLDRRAFLLSARAGAGAHVRRPLPIHGGGGAGRWDAVFCAQPVRPGSARPC